MNMIKLVEDYGVGKITNSSEAIQVVVSLIENEVQVQNNANLMKDLGVISKEESDKIVSASAYAISKLNKIYLLLPTEEHNE